MSEQHKTLTNMPATAPAPPLTGARRLNTFTSILPFVRPYSGQVIFSLITLVSTVAISLIFPIAARRVIDNFTSDGIELLNQYFIAAFFIIGLLAIGTGLRYWLVTRLGEQVIADIRTRIYDRMIGMSPTYYETLMTGEVLSRITTDTTLMLSIIGSSASWFLRNILLFIGCIFLMLWTSPKLTGLVLLIIPPVLITIIILGRRLRTLSKQNQDLIAASSGKASEDFLSIQTIQAFAQEHRKSADFRAITHRSLISARARITLRAIITTAIIFMVFSGVLGVLWIGAIDVRVGAITMGQLVQFLIYAAIGAGSVGALSELWSEIQRAAGATERLIELVNAQDTMRDPPKPITPSAGVLCFDDVSFHFPNRPKTRALDSLCFSLSPGEKVAIVGPSGAGKSTIIQLILRFYDPQSGKITLNGVDLRDMRRQDFRALIGLVPQDPVIFAASVIDNIRFGRPDAPHGDVIRAARAAAGDDFITNLPDGYDTFVGERGVLLSGGQKQRIAIARVILRDAPVLLLDEATSALDAQSENIIQHTLDNLPKSKTSIIIAHRLATIKKADRILVIDDGKIIAQGHHDDLMQQNGLYAHLAKLQFIDKHPMS